MKKQTTKTKDVSELAFSIVQAATGEIKERAGAGRVQLGGGMRVAASLGKPKSGAGKAEKPKGKKK